MTVAPLICKKCGMRTLYHIGDVGQTRAYKCRSCWYEHTEFIKKKKCKHKYDNKNNCMYCGKERNNA